MADLDADGTNDLITGCYEGGSYVLRGKKGGGFEAPKPVLDKAGNVLRVGMFWDYDAKKWSAVETSAFKESLGISAHAVDWDADGDLDLLLGTQEGKVFLRINEGDAKAAAYATESIPVKVGGEDLMAPGGHAMPVAADWDGDGLWDLVTGGGAGGVVWYRNTGKKGAPALAAPQVLVAAGADGVGQRTQACVADFDADGRTDLLVGDYRSGGESGREWHGWVWLFRRTAAPAASKAKGSSHE